MLALFAHPSGRLVALTAALAAAATGCGDEFTTETEPPPPCHPAELEDAFEGDQLSLLWGQQGNIGTTGVANGRGFAELPANQDSVLVGLFSQRQYDLNGCNVWVEVPVVPPAEAVGGAVLTATVGNSFAYMVTEQGLLGMGLQIGDNIVASTATTYDAAAHRWWRIRHDGTTIFFESSADGAAYDTLLQTASPPTYEVNILLGAQVKAPNAEPVRAEFDNLNLLP